MPAVLGKTVTHGLYSLCPQLSYAGRRVDNVYHYPTVRREKGEREDK